MKMGELSNLEMNESINQLINWWLIKNTSINEWIDFKKQSINLPTSQLCDKAVIHATYVHKKQLINNGIKI